jgi:hypothetical protein
MRVKGKITHWNGQKGYGFITPSAGEKQVFVHISSFENRHPVRSECIKARRENPENGEEQQSVLVPQERHPASRRYHYCGGTRLFEI